MCMLFKRKFQIIMHLKCKRRTEHSTKIRATSEKRCTLVSQVFFCLEFLFLFVQAKRKAMEINKRYNPYRVKKVYYSVQFLKTENPA